MEPTHSDNPVGNLERSEQNPNQGPEEPSKESLVFGRSEYAKKEFWNERFASSKVAFDWYLTYKELKKYLENVYPIKKDCSILMVGCGNSKLSEEMYEDGYTNITNIDIASVVIEDMKKHYEEHGINIECLEMDATNMTFPDCTFDAVIDKGTLDAIMCGKNTEVTNSLIREMTRVLKVDGQLFIISHGAPTSRRELFKQAVNIKDYDFMYSEQKLSDMSQLINIFRSKLKDKPLSHILKDKELLKESLREFHAISQKDPVLQRLAALKNAIYKRKAQLDAEEAAKKAAEADPKEIKQEGEDSTKQKEESVPDKEAKQGIENPEKKEDVQIQKEVVVTTTEAQPEKKEVVESKPEISSEAKEKSEHEVEKDFKSKEDIDYRPQRQAHCFIYCVKKKGTL